MSAEKLLPSGFGIVRGDLLEIQVELFANMLDCGLSDRPVALLASAVAAVSVIDADAERLAAALGMPGLGVPALAGGG